jgi:hypothetical protein
LHNRRVIAYLHNILHHIICNLSMRFFLSTERKGMYGVTQQEA